MSGREIDVAKPSLRALSFILRNPQLWPPDFEWSYRRCPNCAVGLTQELWRCFYNNPGDPRTTLEMCRVFPITEDDLNWVFYGGKFRARGLSLGEVTPTMVADAIDQLEQCK